MKILIECQNCFFCFKENTEAPLESCPECGNPDLIEVKKDWNKE
jgi:rRNA maturation endonuclease Nob1